MPFFWETYDNVQGATVPPNGPSVLTLTLGYYFRVNVNFQFVGWRIYSDISPLGVIGGTVWNASSTALLALGITSLRLSNAPQTAPAWKNFYAHPRVHLLANTDYLLGVAVENFQVFQNTNFFHSSSLTNGPITLPQHIPGTNTPNGLTFLRTSLNFPPNTSTGTLYGIDLMILPS